MARNCHGIEHISLWAEVNQAPWTASGGGGISSTGRSITHDPQAQILLLREVLQQPRRPVGLLIGAGCPLGVRVSGPGGENVPLIPDTVGITAKVQKELRASHDRCDGFKILEDQVEDAGLSADVENYLSVIRTLRPLVGSTGMNGLSASELDDLEVAITTEIVRLVHQELPSEDGPYDRLARWAGNWPRQDDPVQIFTTNYDLLTEQALERYGMPYFDGFVGAVEPAFDTRAIERDPLPPRWTRLWKLHGSLNWRLRDGVVSRGQVASIPGSERRLIYPSHLKYDQSRRMPYLVMTDRFRAFYEQPSAVLIVCGYSFRDEHINELIRQGLDANPLAHTFALMYGSLSDYDAVAELGSDLRNLTVLAKDAAIIGTRRADYPSSMVGVDINNAPLGMQWVDEHVERDAQLTPTGVGSTDTKSAEANSYRAELDLGDFASFGRLLDDISQRT